MDRAILCHIRYRSRPRSARRWRAILSGWCATCSDTSVLLLDPLVKLALASGCCSPHPLAANGLFLPIPTCQRVIAPRARTRPVSERDASWTVFGVAILLEVVGVQAHAPGCRGFWHVCVRWSCRKELNIVTVGTTLDLLPDGRLEANQVVDAVRRVRNQPKVVCLLDAARCTDAGFT